MKTNAMNVKKILSSKEVCEKFSTLGEEFVLVKNPDYVHPPFEFYPIAKKSLDPVDEMVAAVTDMDGTTTTTEVLCIHSLEYAVRRMSGNISKEAWAGLDAHIDYPHVIGNSTTKHVEYLIEKYQSKFKKEEIDSALVEATIWTIRSGKDQKRKEEALETLVSVGLKDEIKNFGLEDTLSKGIDPYLIDTPAEELKNSLKKIDQKYSFTELVRIGIEIYYQRYHEILEKIKDGKSVEISAELFGDPSKKLIEPMPGAGIFLALVKGLLGDEAKNLAPLLIEDYAKKKSVESIIFNVNEAENILTGLSKIFSERPIKIAIVTSSIFYEADIVMQEVFRVLQGEVGDWNISEQKKKIIKEKFSHYRNLYDGFITASDSSEIRLKPHRDLYGIALHKLNVKKEDFNKVIGFEDSESGATAIRAAGIGLCIAVPFAETSGHNFEIAAHICEGGLPEAILSRNLFIKA